MSGIGVGVGVGVINFVVVVAVEEAFAATKVLSPACPVFPPESTPLTL